MIDVRLSTYEPVDLTGFPKLTGELAQYIPFDVFPLSNTPIPSRVVDGKDKKYAGWILFLDEFSSANPSVIAAAYKLVLDRQVGSHGLHKKVFIACAGNYAEDGAYVHTTNTAMQSRLVHIHLNTSVTDWLKWATEEGIDHRIIAYIQYRPDSLYVFDPDHDESTFACHRTWGDLLHNIIKNLPTSSLREYQTLMMGTVGMAQAMEFVSFCDVYTNVPTYKEIMAKPMTLVFKEREPAVLFAISSMIPAFCEEGDLEELMDFIYRLPAEFQVITCKGITHKQPHLVKNKHIIEWMVKTGRKYT